MKGHSFNASLLEYHSILFELGGSRPRLPVDQSRTRAGQPSPLQMPSPSVRPRAVRPETQGEYINLPFFIYFGIVKTQIFRRDFTASPDHFVKRSTRTASSANDGAVCQAQSHR